MTAGPRFPGLGIVIPTLDAGAVLAPALQAIAGVAGDVVAVDGGSADDTRERLCAAGVRVVTAPRGRGTQLAAGAAAVRGDWLLFLHADSRPGPGWLDAAAGFMESRDAHRRAAAFRLALDLPGSAARRLERAAAWRCRVFGLPYGDQGLLMSRRLYDEVGGFRPMALMEDVDLARRLGRRRIVMLDAEMLTSGRRYRSGVAARGLFNLGCLGLYFLGVPPRVLARLYAR